MAVVIRHLRRRIILATKHSLTWPSCEFHLDSHPDVCHQQRGLSSIVRLYQIAPTSGSSTLVPRLIDSPKTQLCLLSRCTREAGLWASPSPPSGCRSMPVSTSAPREKEGAQSASESSEQAVEGQIPGADSCREEGLDSRGPQVEAKSQTEDVCRIDGGTDDVAWVDVSMEEPSPSLSKVFTDIIRYFQLPLYLFVHRTLLEKSFDEKEFLEGSKVAYSVVHELFGKAEFEGLETLVSPPLLANLKSVHSRMNTKMEAEGVELAVYDVETIPDTRLVTWNMLVLSGSNYNYGLDKMEQREDYDRELYFMFEIALLATIRVVKKNKAGKVVEKVRLKGAHTLKLARQVPIIKKMFEPVDVVESPWIVLEMSEFREEDKSGKGV